jgi:acyl carrier protein
MVVRIGELVIADEPAEDLLIEVRRDEGGGDGAEDLVHVVLAGRDGRVLGRLTGLLYPAVDVPVTTDADDAADGTDRPWSGLAPDALLPVVTQQVRERIATEMHLSPDELDATRPLVQQGFDSVMSVTVRYRLERDFGLSLASSLFRQRPTLDVLAAHIAEALATAPI